MTVKCTRLCVASPEGCGRLRVSVVVYSCETGGVRVHPLCKLMLTNVWGCVSDAVYQPGDGITVCVLWVCVSQVLVCFRPSVSSGDEPGLKRAGWLWR